MPGPHHHLVLTLICLSLNTILSAQDSTTSVLVSTPYLENISIKANSIDEKLDAKTTKALQQLQKLQAKLKQKLYKKDSLAARDIFAVADARYKALEEKLSNPQKLTDYIPFLDTLKTSLKFLDKQKELLGKTGDIQHQLDGAMSKVNSLEGQLQKAEEVKQFLNQQKQFLQEQIQKFGFAKQLKRLNKDVYYYGQQIKEYKEAIKDPKKIERKAIDLLSRTRLFQDFMKKNSMLASLFRMPADDPNDPAYIQSLAGLQTRVQVNQLIEAQTGGSANALAQMQSNVQQAQGQLQQLKDKVAQYGNGGSGQDMPDFKVNNQKTKSFLKRLEYGTNIQTQRSNGVLPVASDIGLSAGYKINDKSIIGIGASYKMGWGKNIRHLKITNQGVGLRSYVDYKIPSVIGRDRGFWLTGGFEMNYNTEFGKIEQLKDYSAWQKSGLIGISKKFPVSSKFFKSTKLQFLWDYLSYGQRPRSQPIIFRVGYNLK